MFSVSFLILMIIIVGHLMWRYLKFAKHDPDRLQSERYRVQMHRIEVIAAKSMPEPLPANALRAPEENPLAFDNGSEDTKASQSTEGKEKSK